MLKKNSGALKSEMIDKYNELYSIENFQINFHFLFIKHNINDLAQKAQTMMDFLNDLLM